MGAPRSHGSAAPIIPESPLLYPGPPPLNQRTPWKYLLIDVDGTLLDSRGAVSARTSQLVRRAVDCGVRLVLATGRTYHSLNRITGALELPPFHMITNGGAVGLTPGGAEVRHTCFLAQETWREVAAGLEAEGLSTLVFSHRHPEPPLFYVSRTDGDPHFESYVGRNRRLARVAPSLADADVPRVVEVAALGRENGFDAASRRVLERFSGVTRNHSMVLYLEGTFGKITEFFEPGVSKWGAFLALFPEAARDTGAVIAIGDEANDLEMIRAAGMGIAMGNAIAPLKDAADKVTAGHDHEGVAQALEKLGF